MFKRCLSVFIVFVCILFANDDSYLWITNSQGVNEKSLDLKDSRGNPFTVSSIGNSVAVASATEAFVVGAGSSGVEFPYLWVYQNGSVSNGIELKAANGASFVGGNSVANSVAVSSSGIAYVVGAGNLGTADLPYLWIYQNGSVSNGIELKNASGASFPGGSSADNVIVSSSGEVYIVGYGHSGVALPYLWIYQNGSVSNGIELKAANGASFVGDTTAGGVIVSSTEVVYIVGSGDTGTVLPYLWIYQNGSVSNGIELKAANGVSFNSDGNAYSVAISSTGMVYIVGIGNLGAQDLPYLWVYQNGSVSNGIELKAANGASFVGNSVANSVAVSSVGVVYIVGSGYSGVVLPYLWIYQNGRVSNSIELKDANGASFTIGNEALQVAVYSLSPSEALLHSVNQFGNFSFLKGVTSAILNSAAIQVFIAGGPG